METKAPIFSFDRAAAELLPGNVRFGTSSWTYPGWQGLVYHQSYASERSFNRDSLKEYCLNPWFRTVGIDSTFYGPPSIKTLQHYASLVPPGFRWVAKVWERLTIPSYPELPRYGKDAGTTNTDFLNAELFTTKVAAVFLDPLVQPHTGPLVFQFPTIAPSLLSAEDFFLKLEAFLGSLPADLQYAVEIRNPEYLCSEYFALLNKTGSTHCFNHWHRMPALNVQMKAAADAGGLTAPFFVSRILTPLGVSYEQAVRTFQPYSEIRRPNPQMRSDVVRIAKRALQKAVDAFIIVNNRSEGCAPQTIDAIGRMIVSEL